MERRCWACGCFDHVAATCPSRSGAVGKHQGEINHAKSRKPRAYDSWFSGARGEGSRAEELSNRPVRIGVDSAGQALQVMQSSFSVGDEAIVFGCQSNQGTNFRRSYQELVVECSLTRWRAVRPMRFGSGLYLRLRRRADAGIRDEDS